MYSCKSNNIKNSSSFTLLELIVAISISVLVLSGLGAVFSGTLNLWTRVQDSTSALKEGRLAFQWIIRDIRAGGILSIGSNSLELSNAVYSLSNRTNLMRNSDLLAQGVTNLNFTYFNKDGVEENDIDNINFIKISLTIERSGHRLSLIDGAKLRNFN